MDKKECNHQWIMDKVEDFVYCVKCNDCIKDEVQYTADEYIEAHITPSPNE